MEGAAKLKATLEKHVESTEKKIFLNPARGKVCTRKLSEQPGPGGGSELPGRKDEKSEPKRPRGRKRPPADDPPRADPPRAPRPRGPRPEDCECRCGDEGTGERLDCLNNAPNGWIRCPCRQCGPRDTTGGRLDCLRRLKHRVTNGPSLGQAGQVGQAS